MRNLITHFWGILALCQTKLGAKDANGVSSCTATEYTVHCLTPTANIKKPLVEENRQ